MLYFNERIVPVEKKEAAQWAKKASGYSDWTFYKPVFALGYMNHGEIEVVCSVGKPRAWGYLDGWTLEAEVVQKDLNQQDERAVRDRKWETQKLLEQAWAAAQAMGYKRMLLGGRVAYRVAGYERWEDAR